MNRIGKGGKDILQQFLDLLTNLEIDYCVIGGLAVNAYVEPVVSLDLDIVVAAEDLERLTKSAKRIFKEQKFPHSLNLSCPQSELRIQIQTDARYQAFIKNASLKELMGYKMKVATLEDVMQGKIWAYLDEERLASKRQKDLADIFRLIEVYPKLKSLLPEPIRKLIK